MTQPAGAPRLPRFAPPDQLLPPTTDAAGRVRYGDIEVAWVPGFRPLRMDLTLPAPYAGEGAGGLVPVVVWIHGGAFRFGSRLSGMVTEPVVTSLLARGIAVAAVEYRLSGEALFPACLHDVKAAVRWLRRFGPDLGVRADAIGTWGESAGGHLAAFAGLNTTDPVLEGDVGVVDVESTVQASVAWYPPTQLLTMDAQALPGSMPHDPPDSPESLLVGGPIQEHAAAATLASPADQVAAGSPAPMLLVHGLEDRAVPWQQSQVLHDTLVAAGSRVELELVPGAGHVFGGVDVGPIAGRSADWLVERLGPVRSPVRTSSAAGPRGEVAERA